MEQAVGHLRRREAAGRVPEAYGRRMQASRVLVLEQRLHDRTVGYEAADTGRGHVLQDALHPPEVGDLRPHRDQLAVGDALDFWRVEAIEPGSFLRLRAEMKVPGLAWLELRASADAGGSRYDQRAVFFPRGLAGRLYWLAVLPFHGLVFAGMASRIAAAAGADVTEVDPEP